jgi:site-specific DNA-methyltransferase (adenine-specific)
MLRTVEDNLNRLYYGDNLDVLPRLENKSVDLIYLDPPFKSAKQYNVIFKKYGEPSSAQIHAFDDTWSWSLESEASLRSLTDAHVPPQVKAFIGAMFQVLGKNDMMAYLVMMAPRLIELRRVLKFTGSIYLHCDPTASHYLKLLMDQIFGVDNFLNEVVWCYGLGGSSNRYWPRKHDVLLWYSRKVGDQYFVADQIPATSNRMRGMNKKALDYWCIPTINNKARERLGYPTQKPLALLERVVRSSCPEGGVVLDPFCGCGTAVDAAQSLRRRWIGIDIAYIAVDLICNRLAGRYGKEILSTFKVEGVPQDMEGVCALARQNKIDFERWAVSLVCGQPTQAVTECPSLVTTEGRSTRTRVPLTRDPYATA